MTGTGRIFEYTASIRWCVHRLNPALKVAAQEAVLGQKSSAQSGTSVFWLNDWDARENWTTIYRKM
jgi:hypothetical protein